VHRHIQSVRAARPFSAVLRQSSTGDGEISDINNYTPKAGAGGVSGAPAHDIGVEELGGFHSASISSYQTKRP